ncbi:hypothetical protein [Tsuneonella dongtanensis]|uniref:hypothetical protein n=1 Tax=Tsuneonella dongtanensis TaxID=692370 RepID=UPI0008356DCD|nr:hypothetical protein [Tsuneonella dongtanensis]
MEREAFVVLYAGLALAGCDAATQIAGDAVQGEMRNAVTAQCQQAAEGAGIVAGRVAEVCECAVQTFVADKDLNLDDISPTRIEGIVNQCAAQTGGSTTEAEQTMPAEEAGG